MANEIKFEKEWLDAALSQCATELHDMLKSEQAALAKSATDDAPAEESEGSEGPAAPPPSDGDGDADDAPAADAAAEASAPPPGEDSAPPAPGAEASAPAADPAAEAGAIAPAPTVEQLQGEYAKLDPEALKMHYLACKAALMATMGADQGASPDAAPPGAAPAPAAAPPAAAAPPPEASAPMAMGEMKAGKQITNTDGNGGEIEKGKMGKSEKDVEIAALKKQLDEQNKALLQLAEVVATPIRKSIKGVSDLKFIERTEEPKAAPAAKLSKKEVQAVLRDKIREGKLSKADKDLITQYTVGSVDVSKIEHLLASAK